MGPQRSSLGLASFHLGSVASLPSYERGLAALFMFGVRHGLSITRFATRNLLARWHLALHWFAVWVSRCWRNVWLVVADLSVVHRAATGRACVHLHYYSLHVPTDTHQASTALRLRCLGSFAPWRSVCFFKRLLCCCADVLGFNPHTLRSVGLGLAHMGSLLLRCWRHRFPKGSRCGFAPITRLVHFLHQHAACTVCVTFRCRTVPFAFASYRPEG